VSTETAPQELAALKSLATYLRETFGFDGVIYAAIFLHLDAKKEN
jgi:hypothetical protein